MRQAVPIPASVFGASGSFVEIRSFGILYFEGSVIARR